MRKKDIQYYRSRALQEQKAAQEAQCPAARRCHDELAAMYRFRVVMLSNPANDWLDSERASSSTRPDRLAVALPAQG